MHIFQRQLKKKTVTVKLEQFLGEVSGKPRWAVAAMVARGRAPESSSTEVEPELELK